MGKTVTVPHFNRDTVEFASRKRNESNPGIKTLLPFPKNNTEESDFEHFQDLIVALDACYWLHTNSLYKQCPFEILMRKYIFYQTRGKQTERAEQTAAEINSEINHDLVFAVIEVSAVYRFCCKVKPKLTVLKSCMVLSGSSVMVLCFGRDL